MFTYFCNIASDKTHSLNLAQLRIQNMVRFLNPLTAVGLFISPAHSADCVRQINYAVNVLRDFQAIEYLWLHAYQEQNICFMDNKNNNLSQEEKAKKYSKGK